MTDAQPRGARRLQTPELAQQLSSPDPAPTKVKVAEEPTALDVFYRIEG